MGMFTGLTPVGIPRRYIRAVVDVHVVETVVGSKICFNADVYSVDTCGVREEQLQECIEEEICIDGTCSRIIPRGPAR